MGTPPFSMIPRSCAADLSIYADHQPPVAWSPEQAGAPEPSDHENEHAAAVRPLEEPHQASQPILVVDDEESIADLLAEFLASEGYRSVVAHSGREALLSALRERPALILCDWMMPGMNGAQFLAELRRRPATTHVPVVMMSSMRPDWRNFPGVPFLAKPFELDEVLDLVIRATRPSSLSSRLHGEG